jgi:hypothetical protein
MFWIKNEVKVLIKQVTPGNSGSEMANGGVKGDKTGRLDEESARFVRSNTRDAPS